MPRDGKRRIPLTTLATARALRRRQTPAETRLWRRLRDQQVAGLKFRRQHPIGRFVADFCCPAAKLVVEMDGDAHDGREPYDAQRTRCLNEQGYRVIRFTNEDVRKNLEVVLEAIYDACQPQHGPEEDATSPISPIPTGQSDVPRSRSPRPRAGEG